jgi:hypothetical protein
VVTATLAASLSAKAIRLVRAKAKQDGAKALPMFAHKKKRRQRCQRLDQQWRRGTITPTLEELFSSKDGTRFKRQGNA